LLGSAARRRTCLGSPGHHVRQRRRGRFDRATPNTIEQMARDAIAFLDALQFDQVDVLGYSIGSFVAQEMALIRPALSRNIVLASSAPKGAPGMHGWAPEVIDAVGQPQPNPDGYLDVFFAKSPSSHQAGQQTLQRIFGR